VVGFSAQIRNSTAGRFWNAQPNSAKPVDYKAKDDQLHAEPELAKESPGSVVDRM
jgi:hypothetical protein